MFGFILNVKHPYDQSIFVSTFLFILLVHTIYNIYLNISKYYEFHLNLLKHNVKSNIITYIYYYEQ